jgi:hypothetical protein
MFKLVNKKYRAICYTVSAIWILGTGFLTLWYNLSMLPISLFPSSIITFRAYSIANLSSSLSSSPPLLELEQDTAYGWCISAAIGILQDAFVNEPAKIIVISILIGLCPSLPFVNKI